MDIRVSRFGEKNNLSTWLRKTLKNSKNGHVIGDIDYIIRNYKTGEWLLIEEKTNGYKMDYAQEQTAKWLEQYIHRSDFTIKDKFYLGFYTISLSKWSPWDSTIKLIQYGGDEITVTEQELTDFLNFDKKFDDLCAEKRNY